LGVVVGADENGVIGDEDGSTEADADGAVGGGEIGFLVPGGAVVAEDVGRAGAGAEVCVVDGSDDGEVAVDGYGGSIAVFGGDISGEEFGFLGP